MTSRATEPAVADAPTPHPGARHPGQVVVFVITLHVRPGQQAEFLCLLRPVLDAMRHEPTFINAVLYRDPDDPTRFMLYETWADLDERGPGSDPPRASQGLSRPPARPPALRAPGLGLAPAPRRLEVSGG